jgi:hypothetical protein
MKLNLTLHPNGISSVWKWNAQTHRAERTEIVYRYDVRGILPGENIALVNKSANTPCWFTLRYRDKGQGVRWSESWSPTPEAGLLKLQAEFDAAGLEPSCVV